MRDDDYTGGPIDPACPVRWEHPLNVGRKLWLLNVPNSGWRGGVTFRDLCSGGKKNNGALTGGPTWQGPGARPGAAGSLSFTGASSQYVNGSGLSIAGGPFTVAVSFLYGGNTGTLFGAGSSAGTRLALYLQLQSSYQVVFGMYGDDHTFSFPSDDFVSGRWYRMVFTLDASFNERVYRNGKACPDNPIAAGGYFAGDAAWSIGRRIDSSPAYYDGRLDDVTAWAGRALSAAEVARDCALSRRGYPGVVNRLYLPWVESQQAGGANTTITADPGSYSLTGSDVGLRYGRKLSVGIGSYSVAGQAVGLGYGRKLPAAPGSYALSGTAVVLRAAKMLAAAAGSYALSGQAVALRKGPTMAVGSGTFSLIGQDVALRWARALGVGAGSYALGGQAVTLRRGYPLGVGIGSYGLTGQSVALRAGRRLSITAGLYTLSGQPVTLTWSGLVVAVPPITDVSLDFDYVRNAALDFDFARDAALDF